MTVKEALKTVKDAYKALATAKQNLVECEHAKSYNLNSVRNYLRNSAEEKTTESKLEEEARISKEYVTACKDYAEAVGLAALAEGDVKLAEAEYELLKLAQER